VRKACQGDGRGERNGIRRGSCCGLPEEVGLCHNDKQMYAKVVREGDSIPSTLCFVVIVRNHKTHKCMHMHKTVHARPCLKQEAKSRHAQELQQKQAQLEQELKAAESTLAHEKAALTASAQKAAQLASQQYEQQVGCKQGVLFRLHREMQ